MSQISISVTIIAYNEERNIRRCIESIRDIADEILVIDSYSTDRTREICEEYGAKVIENEFAGYVEQKNFAVKHAKYDYICSIDADEQFTEPLVDRILEIKENWTHDAYSFHRLNRYCGKWIYHSGWYPDRKIRLFDRRKGVWGGLNPHDRVILNEGATLKRIREDFLHYTFESFREHMDKINNFTTIAAYSSYKAGRRTFILVDVFVNPLFSFLRDYFIRLGFLDGYYGFVICSVTAFSKVLKYFKLWQIERRADRPAQRLETAIQSAPSNGVPSQPATEAKANREKEARITDVFGNGTGVAGNGSPRFSILIPTWNNLDCIECCVESIVKNSKYDHEILLHINDGSDGTLEWAKHNDRVRFNHSKTNIGICWALNGLRPLVTTDYIVYLNDDMYVCPGWDTALVEEIATYPDNRFFLSSTVIEPYPSRYPEVLSPHDFGHGPSDLEENKLLQRFEEIPANNWSGSTWPPNIVHKEIWDLVGGYSVEFSPGLYSDPDFSMKLWNMGIRSFKGVARSRAYHFKNKTTQRVKANDGRAQFLMKWGITSSTFTKYYLKRGAVYKGDLGDPPGTLGFYLNIVRSKVKRSLKTLV